MKTLFFAAAATLIASQACATGLTTEVMFGSPVKAKTGVDYTEYKVNYSTHAPLIAGVNIGSEVTVKQLDNNGAVSGKVSGRLEYTVAPVVGVEPVVYGEYGEALSQKITTVVGKTTTVTGENYQFWGAGAKASYAVAAVPGLNATAGVRYRASIGARKDVTETRLNVGASYDVLKDTAVGLQYYRVNNKLGTVETDANVVAATLGFKF